MLFCRLLPLLLLFLCNQGHCISFTIEKSNDKHQKLYCALCNKYFEKCSDSTNDHDQPLLTLWGENDLDGMVEEYLLFDELSPDFDETLLDNFLDIEESTNPQGTSENPEAAAAAAAAASIDVKKMLNRSLIPRKSDSLKKCNYCYPPQSEDSNTPLTWLPFNLGGENQRFNCIKIDCDPEKTTEGSGDPEIVRRVIIILLIKDEMGERIVVSESKFTDSDTGNGFDCELCGASFAYSATLKTHKRSHTGEKPFNLNSSVELPPTAP